MRVRTTLCAIALLASQAAAYDGRATYYAVGLGACGWYNKPSDWVVALNQDQYGGGCSGTAHCGQTISITFGSKTVQATVADCCPAPGCGYGDLDMSTGLFNEFASESAGVFYMTWNWGNGNPPQPSTTTTTTTWQPPSTTSETTDYWTPESSATSRTLRSSSFVTSFVSPTSSLVSANHSMSISLSTLANGTVATSTISAPDAESTGSNDGLGITSSSNSTMSADDDGGNIDGVNQLVLQMANMMGTIVTVAS